MTTSQNGWAASSNKTIINIGNPKVPNTDVDFPGGIKNGDVTTVLLYVAEEFNKTVEPLHDGWCWGYDYKVIEGSSSISNHASGTAIDINAPHHPMGVSGTFSSEKVVAIRRILSFCEGVVRWGGDYTGRKDEMHFEINTDAAHVARIAVKIKGHTSPIPPLPDHHIVKSGDTGLEVKHIQQFFHDIFPSYRNSVNVQRGSLITVDGIYGAQTVAWVKEFQYRTSISVDGIVGPSTFSKMRNYGYSY